MVSQEPTLFACSIKDNIMYGKDATLEEVGTLLWLKFLKTSLSISLSFLIFPPFGMLPTSKKLRGHIALGLSLISCVGAWFCSSRFFMHILWTVHDRVLKFHLWIPHGNIADLYFFWPELCPFLELRPFENIRAKSCQQNLSKSIWAMGLKLDKRIVD